MIGLRDLIPCPGCGRHDIGSAHFCDTDRYAGGGTPHVHPPVCVYCWGPVNGPNLDRYGRIKGWDAYCSPVCKKLASRPADAKPSPATKALIAQVAATPAPEAVAA